AAVGQRKIDDRHVGMRRVGELPRLADAACLTANLKVRLSANQADESLTHQWMIVNDQDLRSHERAALLPEKKREHQLSSYAPDSARAHETARPALAFLPFLNFEPNRLRYLTPESCE